MGREPHATHGRLREGERVQRSLRHPPARTRCSARSPGSPRSAQTGGAAALQGPPETRQRCDRSTPALNGLGRALRRTHPNELRLNQSDQIGAETQTAQRGGFCFHGRNEAERGKRSEQFDLIVSSERGSRAVSEAQPHIPRACKATVSCLQTTLLQRSVCTRLRDSSLM